MANDTARDHSSRSSAVTDQIAVLHDRIILAEESLDDACDHVTRETAAFRVELDELRRIVLLFAGLSLMALICALVFGIAYITR